jgi:hypothetical protein
MKYVLNVFSPETHPKFTGSDRTTSGFRVRHRQAAERLSPGDLIVCYLTRLSRWVGLLEVVGAPFEDATPLFVEQDDPFVVRIKVRPLVWLPPEHGIPIHDGAVWSKLSFTKSHSQDSTNWTGAVRTALAPLTKDDGDLLQKLLRDQAAKPREYPLEPSEAKLFEANTVRRAEGAIAVSVPDNQPEPEAPVAGAGTRESIKIQALLAQIGALMGLKIWIPTPDRAAVLKEAPVIESRLLTQLPLNYDSTTLKTIEYIDVLWLKGRSMARAFEVEHTTAIYSGILRMADLLALQPNMDIRLHIVAPEARKEKVYDEIRRPVFSLLEGKPLSARCSFLSYDAIRELAELKHLEHVSDSVLEEYEESANA